MLSQPIQMMCRNVQAPSKLLETRPAVCTAMMQPPVDFVIITPLVEERDALLSRLPGFVKLPPTDEDVRVYFGAQLPVSLSNEDSGAYRLIVVPLLGMGRVEAANATRDAIRRWRPRFVIVVGIAGGMTSAGVRLGDVLLSAQVADYELQKLSNEESSIRWQVHRADPRLLLAAQNLFNHEWLPLVQVKRPGGGTPKRFPGVICTGDKVIANGLAEGYRDVWQKLVGVEMEAGGSASAAFQDPDAPGFFMVRGVSDLADAQKDTPHVGRWRTYACDVAAAFLIGLLRSGPVPLRDEGTAFLNP